MSNLYYKCNEFRLTAQGETITINEPVGWDNVPIVLERDANLYSTVYQYTDGQYLLSFYCDAGKSFLETQYETFGSDAEVTFEFGIVENDIFTAEVTMFVNFALDPSFEDNFVSATLETREFEDKVRTRFDTKVPMDAVESLGGVPLPALTPYDLELHSKVFQKLHESQTLQDTGPVFFQDAVILGTMISFIQIGLDDIIFNEIQQNFTYPTGISGFNPVTNDKFNLLLQEAGGYSFEINVSGQIEIQVQAPAGIIDDYTVQWFRTIGNSSVIFGTDFDTPGTQTVIFNFNHSYNAGPFNTAENTPFYVWAAIAVNAPSGVLFPYNITLNLDSVDTNLKITGNTLKAATNSNVYFIHEVINRNLEVISDTPNILYSEFLGRQEDGYVEDGCGSKNVLTNGFQIRQYDVNNRPLQTSMEENFNSIKARWNLGLGFETIGGERKVRIEQMPYFFQDKEIIRITEISDYKETPARDITYNEYEIGYKNFGDVDIGSIDEFNTTNEGLTPITKTKNKLTYLSDYNSSGYSIEETRRQIDKPSESFKTDDNIFMIAVQRDGMVNWITEKDEPFDIVNNVISPETSYNLRHSPLRMLFEHAIVLNSGLFYKDELTEEIKFRFGKQNYLLQTQFNDLEPCPLGDPDKLLWQENQDFILNIFNQYNKLFQPEWIDIECRLSFEDVTTITDAMQGASALDINYGYITVVNNKGNDVQGFLYRMDYLPGPEKATMRLLKKGF